MLLKNVSGLRIESFSVLSLLSGKVSLIVHLICSVKDFPEGYFFCAVTKLLEASAIRVLKGELITAVCTGAHLFRKSGDAKRIDFVGVNGGNALSALRVFHHEYACPRVCCPLSSYISIRTTRPERKIEHTRIDNRTLLFPTETCGLRLSRK